MYKMICDKCSNEFETDNKMSECQKCKSYETYEKEKYNSVKILSDYEEIR